MLVKTGPNFFNKIKNHLRPYEFDNSATVDAVGYFVGTAALQLTSRLHSR